MLKKIDNAYKSKPYNIKTFFVNSKTPFRNFSVFRKLMNAFCVLLVGSGKFEKTFISKIHGRFGNLSD